MASGILAYRCPKIEYASGWGHVWGGTISGSGRGEELDRKVMVRAIWS